MSFTHGDEIIKRKMRKKKKQETNARFRDRVCSSTFAVELLKLFKIFT